MRPRRIYIAGRFRGETLAAVQRHIDVASWFQAPIAAAGAFPVCVHKGEGLAMHDLQQANHGAFWLETTMDELRTCDAVVLVPGWQTSTGSYAEAAEAIRLGLPVFLAPFAPNIAEDTMPEPAQINAWPRVRELLGQAGSGWAVQDFRQTFKQWLEEQG